MSHLVGNPEDRFSRVAAPLAKRKKRLNMNKKRRKKMFAELKITLHLQNDFDTNIIKKSGGISMSCKRSIVQVLD